MTKIRHGGVSYPAMNGTFLRLDGTNVPTANYSWTTNLTTTMTLQGTNIVGTATGLFGGTLTIASGSITDTTGTITFDNENLITTGSITGNTIIGTVSGTFGGTLTIASGSITDTTGTISFGNENLTTTGTITGGTLTDGVATLIGGAWTGVVSINGLSAIGCAANTISITCGTTDLTVSTDCAINQNLNTAASPSFVTVTGTTSVVANTMTMATGSITDTTGAISFGNENLTTTGTIQGTTLTDGTFSVTGGVITGATNTNWDIAYAHSQVARLWNANRCIVATTTAGVYTTINNSDLCFNPQHFVIGGALYARFTYHIRNSGANITYIQAYRQNAGTAVANSAQQTSAPHNSWQILQTGWIDFSGEPNALESFQIQMYVAGGTGYVNYWGRVLFFNP